jgi:hypothetical protein
MIPHYFGPFYLVLAIDFERGHVLVGELTESDGDRQTVWSHLRYRYVDGAWYRDVPAGELRCPRLDAEPYSWREARKACLKSPQISVQRRYVSVQRTDLARALNVMRKVTGKSLGPEGLCTLRVHPRGLTVVAHGPARAVYKAAKSGTDDARDGLGEVVVLGEALRQAVKEASSPVCIAVGSKSPTQAVRVGERDLWTVKQPPVEVPALGSRDEASAEIAAAVLRAYPFISDDDARPICRVQIQGRGDEVEVTGTDGHRLYQETVDAPGFGESTYYVPHDAIKAAISKRHPTLHLTFDDGSLWLEAAGVQIRCEADERPYPPVDALVKPLARFPAHELPGDCIAPLRKFFAESDEETVVVRIEEDGLVTWDAEVDTSIGGNLRGFNPDYLASAFDLFDGAETLSVKIDPQKLGPFAFIEGRRLLLVMPQRL